MVVYRVSPCKVLVYSIEIDTLSIYVISVVFCTSYDESYHDLTHAKIMIGDVFQSVLPNAGQYPNIL